LAGRRFAKCAQFSKAAADCQLLEMTAFWLLNDAVPKFLKAKGGVAKAMAKRKKGNPGGGDKTKE